MFSVFTTWAEQNLDSYDWTGRSLDFTILVRAPLFVDDDVAYPDYLSDLKATATLSDLLDKIGWQDTPNDGAASLTPNIDTADGNDYFTAPDETVSYWDDNSEGIFAAAFVLSTSDDDLICVLRPEVPLFMYGSANDPCYFTASDIAGVNSGNGYYFSHLTEEEDLHCQPQVGPISITVPSVKWEASRSAHVWMAPQRVNFAVNPSFEISESGLWGWRASNGTTLTQEDGGMGRNGRIHCAGLAGGNTKVLESLPFPSKFGNEWWSLEAAVSGAGTVSLGIVFLLEDGEDKNAVLVDSGPIPISTVGTEDLEGFSTIRALIRTPPTALEGLLRITCVGSGDFFVDDVLVDPNEAQLGYFDGDWPYGQNGDYGWYGDQDDHKTYSVFYNNRKNLTQTLFGHYDSDNLYHNGLAEKWAPEGVAVIPHWDDIFAVQTPTWYSDVFIPTENFTATQKTDTFDFHLRLSGTITGFGTVEGIPNIS